MSGTDLCKDGKSFSVGLWQINILVNHSLLPGCSGGFYTSSDGGQSQGECDVYVTNSAGVKYCQFRSCEIKPDGIPMYNYCVSQAKNPTLNTAAACSLMRTQSWGAWETSYNRCY